MCCLKACGAYFAGGTNNVSRSLAVHVAANKCRSRLHARHNISRKLDGTYLPITMGGIHVTSLFRQIVTMRGTPSRNDPPTSEWTAHTSTPMWIPPPSASQHPPVEPFSPGGAHTPLDPHLVTPLSPMPSAATHQLALEVAKMLKTFTSFLALKDPALLASLSLRTNAPVFSAEEPRGAPPTRAFAKAPVQPNLI